MCFFFTQELALTLCLPRQTVISDYDDPKLISNIEHNIRANDQTGTHAVGQTWGSSVRPLLEPLDGNRFDVILLADIVFNHSQHAALLQTCEAILHGERGRALCFYSHHRPWLVDADERLFSLAEERGWRCERVWRDEEAGVRRNHSSVDLISHPFPPTGRLPRRSRRRCDTRDRPRLVDDAADTWQ